MHLNQTFTKKGTNMTTTFENADVGDRVWSYDQGWGTIKSIDFEREYPIHVIFDNCSHYTFPISGAFSEYVSRQLFWDEIKFEIPVQPPRMRLINGIEVPDISFKPRKEEHFYHPVLDKVLYNQSTYLSYGIDDFRVAHGLCYPYTEEGKQAAILHAKAMLGIKD
jgi:hypothetical protein